jgi:hypothetical protein
MAPDFFNREVDTAGREVVARFLIQRRGLELTLKVRGLSRLVLCPMRISCPWLAFLGLGASILFVE